MAVFIHSLNFERFIIMSLKKNLLKTQILIVQFKMHCGDVLKLQTNTNKCVFVYILFDKAV